MRASANRASSPVEADDEDEEGGGAANPSMRSKRGLRLRPYRVCGRIESAASSESSWPAEEDDVARRK